MHVLDASAAIAAINREPGFERVVAVFDDALICSVNLAEVVALLAARNREVQVRAIVAAYPLEVFVADADLAVDAGLLRDRTDRAGLSLGDRFCLATARRLGAPALTADRAWSRIADAAEVKVELIR